MILLWRTVDSSAKALKKKEAREAKEAKETPTFTPPVAGEPVSEEA